MKKAIIGLVDINVDLHFSFENKKYFQRKSRWTFKKFKRLPTSIETSYAL